MKKWKPYRSNNPRTIAVRGFTFLAILTATFFSMGVRFAAACGMSSGVIYPGEGRAHPETWTAPKAPEPTLYRQFFTPLTPKASNAGALDGLQPDPSAFDEETT